MSQITTGLNLAHDDFCTSLNRIRRLAETVFDQTSIEPERLELNNTQQSGCTVLLTGFFEDFLKSAIREFVVSIPKTGVSFDELPKKMRRLHFEGGGKVLSDVVSREASGKPQFFRGISVDDVVSRLHSPTSGNSDEYFIVWEAFADTKQSPTSATVSDLLKALSISSIWPGIYEATGVRTLDATLSELIEKRNECAHTGRNTSVPTALQIIGYVDALEKIAQGIVHLLCERLVSFPCGADPYAWR